MIIDFFSRMEPINLQKLSTTYIAAKIWETPVIKKQIRDKFLRGQTKKLKINEYFTQRSANLLANPDNKEHYKDFLLITNLAVQQLDFVDLPLDLVNDCKHVIREMGEKIYDWILYVTEMLEFDFKFAEKIYWLPDGTIDEDKIFKSWENDQEFLNQKDLRIPASHLLACITVQQEYINNNQFEMEKFIRFYMPRFHLSDHSNNIYTLMALYLHLQITGKIFSEDYNLNNVEYIISPQMMFDECTFAGLTKAAFYFWDGYLSRFNNNEEFLIEISDKCMFQYSFISRRYQRSKINQVVLFLISKMTAQQKSKFFKKYAVRLSCLFLDLWPIHGIIFELLDNYSSELSIFDYRTIFTFILYFIRDSELACLNKREEHLRLLFHKIFTNLPKNLRQEIFISKFVVQNFCNFDIKCLNLVMSDMDQNLRAELLQEVQPRTLLLVKNGKIDRLNEFMKQILISEDERNSFKEYILSFIDDILMEADFKNTNKLFDYFSLSKEERFMLKSRINCLKLCERFILTDWRYDQAEKFLQWMFDNEEDREKLRNSLKENAFILNRPSKAFDRVLSNFIGSQANRQDFLNFFFGFPEEKESIKNKEMYLNFRDKLLVSKGENTLLNDLSSGSLPAKKMVCGKMFFPSSFFELCDKSELPNLFLNWICKDVERKNAIKRMYDNDSERRFFCKLVFLMLG